jgi:hypothetical protein
VSPEDIVRFGRLRLRDLGMDLHAIHRHGRGHAIWGCCSSGIPRFASGFTTAQMELRDAYVDLYAQVLNHPKMGMG